MKGLNMDATANCPCGNCPDPWSDVDSDEYLYSHFECDVCGSDYPMTQVVTVAPWVSPDDRFQTYTGLVCQRCDEVNGEQPDFSDVLAHVDPAAVARRSTILDEEGEQ